jgi:hemerythrin-like domain-containing protein
MRLADLIPDGFLNDENDAIGLLEAEHDKLLELFERFEKTRGDASAAQKEAIVAEACGTLKRHMRTEEDVFYPAVRDSLHDEMIMNEALVEHDGAKTLVDELENMDGEDDMFDAKFKVLAEYTRHHIKEEREQMFPRVRASSLDLKTLGEKMIASEKVPPIRRRLPRSDRQRPFPVT